jgi:hypothetical protein
MRIDNFPEFTQLTNDFLLLGYNTEADITGVIKLSTLKDFIGSGSIPPVEMKLTGTPFGALPVYQAGREPPSAFDGNLTTSYNYISLNGGYVGLDLGANNTKKLIKVRIYPRQEGVHTRSSGAKIQGSNQSETTGYTDLYTFPQTATAGLWYESPTLSVNIAYRYLRYVGVDGTYSDVSEIEFYGF